MNDLACRTLCRRGLVPADGGSTPKPGRKDIAGRIDVPIVRYTTSHADPRPYSKVSQTLGPREGAAIRTRSRGVSFVDDPDGPAGILAFITQHLSEQAPSAVEHGSRHPCLDQLQAAHIA